MADPYASGKTSRFVGICIERKNYGLGAAFKLRNVIDGQGIVCLQYQIVLKMLVAMENVLINNEDV